MRATTERWTPRRALAGLLEAVPRDRLVDWWPTDAHHHAVQGTDPRDERIIGAVLVQNTNWTQVQRALDRLRDADVLALDRLEALPLERLRTLVRPAGFWQRKPVTLQALAQQVAAEGGLDVLAEQADDDPDPVRRVLLEVPGVGPETADAILAFALGCRVFVVDAYTRRLMSRLGVRLAGATAAQCDPERAPYDAVAPWWTRGDQALPRDAEVWRIAHAAIIEHAKLVCRRAAPRCPVCPLRADCALGRSLTFPS